MEAFESLCGYTLARQMRAEEEGWDRTDKLLDEYQREIVKWHDFEKCGASPELLNRQREKILGLKEVCRGALYATGLDALSWPSSFYTPVPPEMRGKRKGM